MSKKITATLDLTGCKYWNEMHQRIKKALYFPEYYGENWSAFWKADNLYIKYFANVLKSKSIDQK